MSEGRVSGQTKVVGHEATGSAADAALLLSTPVRGRLAALTRREAPPATIVLPLRGARRWCGAPATVVLPLRGARRWCGAPASVVLPLRGARRWCGAPASVVLPLADGAGAPRLLPHCLGM